MSGPHNVLGIELNEYAAELARVTVWIGELQWRIQRGYGFKTQPVLEPLEHIECRDAVLNADGREAAWPKADVVVGNPPFVGDKKMRAELGDAYTEALRAAYKGRVPGGADLVCYWFEKARARIETGHTRCAGLVATNSIRGGANRKVLARISSQTPIFEAWSDEPWIVDGAAVRVSLVCFAAEHQGTRHLDGQPVLEIYPDLTGATVTAGGLDLTQAQPLSDNTDTCFQGAVRVGPFDITGELARAWLQLPTNPNGLTNRLVLRPLRNAMDLVRRSRDAWIIDFRKMQEQEAALFEAPFEYARFHIKPYRDNNRDEGRRKRWWLHGRTGDELRAAIARLDRCIATPQVAKHRIFVWLPTIAFAESTVLVFARDDDTTFGILHSRFHELWALRLGTSLEDRPRYTPTTTFETFPFPDGLTPNIPAADYADDPRAQAIAQAARRLNELREHWLNPPEWVRRVPEIVPGYPDRWLPVDEKAAALLKKRTLTHLYNERPAWLANAHRDLDAAVAAAYGWPADLSDDEVLRCLLALNQERARENS